MSKNEIRMRRQRLTAHGSERFRNYGAILERHEKEQRLKKVLRVFGFLLVILIFVMLIVIVVRMEKKAVKEKPVTTSQVLHSTQETERIAAASTTSL